MEPHLVDFETFRKTHKHPHVSEYYGNPDYPSWQAFLDTIDLRETHEGWKWYNSSNCHYFVSPEGCLVLQCFGYKYFHVWNEIKNGRGNEIVDKAVCDAMKLRQFLGLMDAMDKGLPVSVKAMEFHKLDPRRAYVKDGDFYKVSV